MTSQAEHDQIARMARHAGAGFEGLPPELSYVRDLTPLVEQRARLQVERKASAARIEELQLETRRVAGRDARALRAGEPLSGRSVEAIEADIETEQRLSEAATVGFKQIERDRKRRIEDNRTAYLAEFQATMAPMREGLAALIAELGAAWRALASVEAAWRTVADGREAPALAALPSVAGVRVDMLFAEMQDAAAKIRIRPDEPSSAVEPRESPLSELVSGKRAVGTGWGRYAAAVGGGTVSGKQGAREG